MALPNKTFWVNYNARNYNSTTLTIPKENGQLFDNDLVFPSAVTYNDDHITISSNKKVSFIFNSTSENIFNRTTSTATITIIAKIANGRNMWFLANRLVGASQIGWMVQYGSKYQMAYIGDSNSYTSSTSPMIFTWRCGNGTQQYIAHSDNVVGTPYQSTDWVGRESTAMHFFGGGDGSTEYWTGDFYWMYISPETLTDAEIQAVIDYNENPQTQLVQIPVNKYKLYTSNIQKTYNGSTQINKMYVGNDLVYRALPTTTGPQLQMPLNEVWYKTTNNNSIGLRSGTYYTDSNGNQLTYTESFDSVSGLWKMVFSDDVYGCQGPVYYNNDDRLVEVWYPYGYVKPNPMFAYGQTHLEKFKGDSPAIVDNGNAILCIVDCTVDGVNGKNFVMQAVTSGATTINIPEGALGVGPYSFFKATAITISLPSTITYVGNYCFERTNLTTLNCYATTVPTTFSNIWYAVGNSGTLHYPTGSDYSSFPVPSRWTKVGDL